MESSLRLRIAHLRRDRTGSAGGASSGEAIRGTVREIAAACGGVVRTARGKSGDRASRKARSLTATVTRVRHASALREIQAFAQAKRSAIGVPQTPLRMNQQTEGRAVDGLRPQCPALKVQPRRSIERVEGDAIELDRNFVDNPLRPTVKRVRKTVIRFRRRSEHRPLHAAGPAEQHDRQRGRTIGKGRDAVLGSGVKGAPAGKTQPRETTNQFVQSACHDNFRKPRGCGAAVAHICGGFDLFSRLVRNDARND
jgi:hypothetical protein